MDQELSAIQQSVVDLFLAKKFVIDSTRTYDGDSGPTVFMSYRPNRFSTRYVEIDFEGRANGQLDAHKELRCLL